MKTTDKIHALERFGSKLGLERMEKLLSRIGNPQETLRVIHVAGTNGKGSVCRYIYAALRASGFTVGLYTSPFVTTFLERIEYEGAWITEAELDESAGAAFEASAAITADGGESPTEFEVITAAAFHYFAKKRPDFVVLEVGLGGRGDATNVISHPVLTVITPISLDHTDRLGDTIPKIAAEKAGILKPGCPVVCGAGDEAAGVIREKADALDAPFVAARIQKDLAVRNVRKELTGYQFDVEILGRQYENLRLSMAGDHQIENAVIALTALELLSSRYALRLNSDRIKEGLAKAVMPGRLELVSAAPPVLIDGAHNPAGASALADAMKQLFPGRRILVIMGLLADKSGDGILEAFRRFACGFVLTEPGNDRKLPVDQLAEMVNRTGAPGASSPAEMDSAAPILAEKEKPAEALQYAIKIYEEGGCDMIVAAGSLYLVGDIRKEVLDHRADRAGQPEA